MKILQPRTSMKPQNQLAQPVVSDTTLVDDTVALVDDPVALVGGQTAIFTVMRLKVKTVVPSARIRIRR